VSGEVLHVARRLAPASSAKVIAVWRSECGDSAAQCSIPGRPAGQHGVLDSQGGQQLAATWWPPALTSVWSPERSGAVMAAV
jgi:hypothetical protein